MLTDLDVVSRSESSLAVEHTTHGHIRLRGRAPTNSTGPNWAAHDDDFLQTLPSDAAVKVSPANVAKHHRVHRAGLGAEIVQVTRRERTEFHFEAPVHLLVLFERGSRTSGESSVEGLPRSSLKELEQKLIFVPAGHRYDDWQVPRTLTRAVYFYFSPTQPPMSLALPTPETGLSPRLFFEDTAVQSTALKLAAIVESASAFSRLYFDALSLVLAHEIVRFAQGRASIEPRAHGGLAPWQQRIVVDYIEEHLSEQIPLATLAELVRLSPYYFCRAFKQSMGMPPHRYHTRQRIELAKSLLANGSISITQIGLSVGFNETSSFTATFRKTMGITPTAYRRSLA